MLLLVSSPPPPPPHLSDLYVPIPRAFLAADVLDNWEKYTARQDGDAIRRLIGTIGVSSPLSSIRKAFTSIRDAEEASVSD